MYKSSICTLRKVRMIIEASLYIFYIIYYYIIHKGYFFETYGYGWLWNTNNTYLTKFTMSVECKRHIYSEEVVSPLLAWQCAFFFSKTRKIPTLYPCSNVTHHNKKIKKRKKHKRDLYTYRLRYQRLCVCRYSEVFTSNNYKNTPCNPIILNLEIKLMVMLLYLCGITFVVQHRVQQYRLLWC